MDYINIPSCALFRHGTVIVRLKMEVSNGCCEPEVCPTKGCPKVVHRLSRCELCTRTRYNSRFSDCDSGKLVEKCRPYRLCTARSRYVNVCAAVCLLFLVGSLAPQSLAAPGPRPTMSGSDEKEDALWANPCGYVSSNNTTIEYVPKLAMDVAIKARNAMVYAESYKDEFASKRGFAKFSDLQSTWDGYFWIQEFSWARVVLPQDKPVGELKDVVQTDEKTGENYLVVPPRTKVYGKKLSDAYLEQLMKVIGDVLPTMYKSLKAVGSAMLSVTKDLNLYSKYQGDKALQEKLNKTAFDVRAILCLFSDLLRSDKFRVDHPIPLLDSEVSKYKDSEKQAILVYIDTLNYLEYLEQVFDKMVSTSIP